MPTNTETTTALYSFDKSFQDEFGLVCGVDEAGRGPLCGPVCVAAVILDASKHIDGLNDSKKTSESKREKLYESITETAVSWHAVLVPPDEIDRLNILGATMSGMKSAVEGLQKKPDCVLVDGNKSPQLDIPSHCVVKGDAKSASIAAASIIAKVTRDRYMLRLDKMYPQYMLAKHKGYPTKMHYQLINMYGVQPFYRKSFLKNLGSKHGFENNG